MSNLENEKNESIKKENRKALKIYIPTLLICAVLGGVVGFFTATGNVQRLGTELGSWLGEFFYQISPYCLIAAEVISIAASLYFYLSARKAAEGCSGEEKEDEHEEETLYEQADIKISRSMIAANMGLILNFLFFGISFSQIDRNCDERLVLFMISIAVFILSAFAEVRLNQLQVDLTKRLNPKMKGSVYDMKFHKKWEESCDEAEKLTIYKAAYKAFQMLNKMCSTLWLLLLLGSMVFHYGALPVVVVTLIWLTVTLTYYREGMRLEHGKINE